MNDCIFCRIVAGELPADVVHRSDHFLAFRDIHPKHPVHVLVIPLRHVRSVAHASELSQVERAEMPVFISDVARVLGVEGTGYRVATNHGHHARQDVQHLHWHVLGGELLSATM